MKDLFFTWNQARVGLLVLGLIWGNASISLFAQNSSTVDRFYWALYNNDLKKIHDLIQGGASPNGVLSSGDEPLVVAASRGFREAMEMLLEKGASPETRDSTGTPVLALAIQSGRLDSVRLLVRWGADPDQMDRIGRSSLWFAVQRDNPRILRQILLYRPNLEAVDQRGRTLLMVAVESGTAILVRFLLDQGADPWRYDYFGRSPLEYARIREDEEILMMIRLARNEG